MSQAQTKAQWWIILLFFIILPCFTACPKRYIKSVSVLLQYIIVAGVLISGKLIDICVAQRVYTIYTNIQHIHTISFMSFNSSSVDKLQK